MHHTGASGKREEEGGRTKKCVRAPYNKRACPAAPPRPPLVHAAAVTSRRLLLPLCVCVCQKGERAVEGTWDVIIGS